MKVLFLPSHYIFDDNQYGSELDLAYNLVNRLAQEFDDSVVVTGSSNLLNTPAYRVIEVQPKNRNYDMSFMNAIKYNLRYTIMAFRLLRSEKFDLLHHVRPFTLGITFNLAVLVGKNRNIPFVIGAFCSPYLKKDPANYKKKQNVRNLISHSIERLAGLILAPLSYATIRKAKAVFVVDSHTKKLVEEKVPGVNVIVVPPGKNKDAYSYSDSKSFEEGALVFISASNFITRKGLDMLIIAFSEIANEFPEAKLMLVGDGSQEGYLRNLVTELGISRQVTFSGRVSNSEMPSMYAKADVYVAMPLEESFGHSYIEALATGLPVISTKTIGSSEVLSGSSIGKIIPQGDIKAMAAQMRHFLQHPEKVSELSKNARAEFIEKYDWSVIIARYLEVYEEIFDECTQTVPSVLKSYE